MRDGRDIEIRALRPTTGRHARRGPPYRHGVVARTFFTLKRGFSEKEVAFVIINFGPDRASRGGRAQVHHLRRTPRRRRVRQGRDRLVVIDDYQGNALARCWCATSLSSPARRG
jgi:hypothetical protein